MVNSVIKIATRDLRGGLAKFRIFLICLFLGVFAISLIGTFKETVKAGLQKESAEILGGDISLNLAYRVASQDEKNEIKEISNSFSELISFRTMISGTGQSSDVPHALAKAKGVDDKYPLYGDVIIEPAISIEDALRERNGIYGIIAEPLLIEQLQLKIGSLVKLGNTTFELRGRVLSLPDSGSDTFSLGSKIIIYSSSLKDSGLLGKGTLYETNYYIKTREQEDLEGLKSSFTQKFFDRGFRWRDRRNPAPGIESFVNRLSFFLTVLGMAGLIIGGVGISTAVGSYLTLKRGTIATLKTLGATSATLTKIYLSQILILSLTGTTTGALAGSSMCYVLKPILINVTPFPLSFDFYPRPIMNAMILGLLVSLIFSLIPLMKACREKVSDLFRSQLTDGKSRIPGVRESIFVISLIAALIFLIIIMAPEKKLAIWFIIGTIFSFLVLHMISFLTQKASLKLSSSEKMPSLLPLKLAFASIGNGSGENKSVLISIGIGLIVLATMGQIEKNIETSLEKDLPAIAPAFFLIDIQSAQKRPLIDILQKRNLITDLKMAPMLRGFITKINDMEVSNLNIDHWALRGDRGITYEDTPTTAQNVTRGEWWPSNYKGSPQISFSQNEGQELGLDLGDTLTVNILGRDLTGTITSFREVNFATMGINFLMVFNPHSLSSAPHTHIATVYASPQSEASIIKIITSNFPNITSVSVRETINKIQEMLIKISLAMKWCALLIICMGFFVIMGALAASEQSRAFEASILKTLGARKSVVLFSFGLRSLIIGSVAGLVSLSISAIMAWVVISYFLKSTYTFDLNSGIWIVLIGISITILTSALFAIGPLKSKPARVLRAED